MWRRCDSGGINNWRKWIKGYDEYRYMKYVRLGVYLVAALIGFATLFSMYVFRGANWPFGLSVLDLIGIETVTVLYLSLLPSPLYEVFPGLPGKFVFQRAKKALGISSFVFAAVYAAILWLAFKRGLGPGPFEWGAMQIIHVGTGASALFILALLAITSIKAIKQRIRPWWKTLHRFVYLAGALIVVHLATVASSQSRVSALFIVAYLLIEFLFLIQLIRFDRFFRARYPAVSRAIVSMGFPLLSLLLFWAFFLT